MHIFAISLAAVLGGLALPAGAQTSAGAAQFPSTEIKWGPMTPATGPGAESAILTGSLDKPGGMYTLRIRMAKGGMVKPHVHPDDRYVTVLSGDMYAGRGDVVAEDKASVYPPESYYKIPAGAVHFAWAGDGEVVYQESGLGPSGNSFLGK